MVWIQMSEKTEENFQIKLLNEKFIEDELRADKEMIKKIINFDHNKRKNKLIDEGVISEDDEDYIKKKEWKRMKMLMIF